jgi:NADH-quinone oxidoreductase subunit C
MQPKVPGSMANESKAPQSPGSSQPDVSGSPPVPSAAGTSPSSPIKAAGPGPLQTALDNEFSRRYRDRFGVGILDALEDRRQSILIIDSSELLEIARYSRDDEKFHLLEDYTAVDWPRREKRFDLVAQLYSFTYNTRLRLKIPLGADEQPATLVPVWPAANWLEREIFDLFGIAFRGHPNLKRILLPDEWQGHPLRKDYDILQQDTAWVRENLSIESGQ